MTLTLPCSSRVTSVAHRARVTSVVAANLMAVACADSGLDMEGLPGFGEIGSAVWLDTTVAQLDGTTRWFFESRFIVSNRSDWCDRYVAAAGAAGVIIDAWYDAWYEAIPPGFDPGMDWCSENHGFLVRLQEAWAPIYDDGMRVVALRATGWYASADEPATEAQPDEGRHRVWGHVSYRDQRLADHLVTAPCPQAVARSTTAWDLAMADPVPTWEFEGNVRATPESSTSWRLRTTEHLSGVDDDDDIKVDFDLVFERCVSSERAIPAFVAGDRATSVPARP